MEPISVQDLGHVTDIKPTKRRSPIKYEPCPKELDFYRKKNIRFSGRIAFTKKARLNRIFTVAHKGNTKIYVPIEQYIF